MYLSHIPIYIPIYLVLFKSTFITIYLILFISMHLYISLLYPVHIYLLHSVNLSIDQSHSVYIYIIIMMTCRQLGYPWPSLATSLYHSSPPAGLQGYILCPHIVAECKFELVVLLLHGHMWGSIGVHHLYIYIYISYSVYINLTSLLTPIHVYQSIPSSLYLLLLLYLLINVILFISITNPVQIYRSH